PFWLTRLAKAVSTTLEASRAVRHIMGSRLSFLESLSCANDGKSSCVEVESSVTLGDGVAVPLTKISARSLESTSDRPLLVLGHGFTRDRGDWCSGLRSVLDASFRPPSPLIAHGVAYDARGHGGSEGWQGKDRSQFHWSRLGRDMLEVAEQLGGGASKLLLGGESMGSMAALWAATLEPEKVRGVFLYKVPTIWAARAAARGKRLAGADEMEDADLAERARGAAEADCVDASELVDKLRDIPVVIVQDGAAATRCTPSRAPRSWRRCSRERGWCSARGPTWASGGSGGAGTPSWRGGSRTAAPKWLDLMLLLPSAAGQSGQAVGSAGSAVAQVHASGGRHGARCPWPYRSRRVPCESMRFHETARMSRSIERPSAWTGLLGPVRGERCPS
ncbi:unnamed protein product, partial [Prorocentrum cordatum]